MPQQNKVYETADAFSDCFFGPGDGDEKAARLMAFANETEASIKTKKTDTGNRQAVKNATLIVRLANSVGIEHTKITEYYEGDSGMSMPNDFQKLKEISILVVKHFKGSDIQSTRNNIRQGFTTFVDSFNTSTTQPQTEATTNNDMSIDFGDNMPSLDDMVDDEEVEEAQATELNHIFDALNGESFKAIQAVSDEDIEAAKAVLFNLAKDGKGYEQDKNNGTQRVEAKILKDRAGWANFSIMQPVIADIIEIRPSAKVNRADLDGNYRHWFAELCGHLSLQKKQIVKRILVKVAAAVINGSGRKFYNMRFTHFVSKQFKQDVQAWIDLNQELADSKVIKGTAHNWRWVPKENDWQSSQRTPKMSDADIDSMSIKDLQNL